MYPFIIYKSTADEMKLLSWQCMAFYMWVNVDYEIDTHCRLPWIA